MGTTVGFKGYSKAKIVTLLNESWKDRLKKSALRNTKDKCEFVLWQVVEGNDGKNFIAAFLLSYYPDEKEWAYKDVCESMYPREVNCPASYLKLAPVACEKWREEVRRFNKGEPITGIVNFAAGDTTNSCNNQRVFRVVKHIPAAIGKGDHVKLSCGEKIEFGYVSDFVSDDRNEQILKLVEIANDWNQYEYNRVKRVIIERNDALEMVEDRLNVLNQFDNIRGYDDGSIAKVIKIVEACNES